MAEPIFGLGISRKRERPPDVTIRPSRNIVVNLARLTVFNLDQVVAEIKKEGK
jgi:hypothetical protein